MGEAGGQATNFIQHSVKCCPTNISCGAQCVFCYRMRSGCFKGEEEGGAGGRIKLNKVSLYQHNQ